MTISYGLTIENQNAINKKAKNKNDGIYSFRGICYRVENKRATYFAVRGNILQNFGSFNVVLGNYNDSNDWNYVKAKKALKEI